MPFQVIAQSSAATMAGAIFDATSTYTAAFIIAVFISFLGLICAFYAGRT
jgi:hypothetical protein